MIINEHGQPVGVSVEVTAPEPPPAVPLVGTYATLVLLDAAAHGEQLFEAFSGAADEADWTYLPYGPFESVDDFMSWLFHVEGQTDPMFFTVVDNRDDTCAGLASYLRIDRYAASVEVGHIHFSRDIQGTPATTEAMFLMMVNIFAAGYRRYEWKCDDLNVPSRAAALRLGFSYEGTFRQATHYKGRNRDTAWFGMTDQDWHQVRAEFERWLDPSNFDADGQQRSPLHNRR